MIIGLGYKARAGKDTIASHLVGKYDFVQESFAYPLKEQIGRQIMGFNDKQLYGEWKEVLDPEWGRTPRQLLQLIGTDALRKVVHDDFWVIPMKRKLKEHTHNKRNVVISDVRFLNEINAIKALGGQIVRVDRDNPDQITGFAKHQSETELDNYEGWDQIITNNSTIEALYQAIDEHIKYVWRWSM